MTGLHDQRIEPGAVGLSVRDLERSLDFYRDAIGLEVLTADGAGPTSASAAGACWRSRSGAGAQRDMAQPDLFHLRCCCRRARRSGAAPASDRGGRAADRRLRPPRQRGALPDDPDGHGIELYRDRPRESWLVDGRIHLITERLDHEGVLAAGEAREPGTGSTPARSWATSTSRPTTCRPRGAGTSSARVRCDLCVSQATFMSIGGYHHHVAVNVWGKKRKPADPAAGGIGMLWYELQRARGSARRPRSGVPDARRTDGTLTGPMPTASRFASAIAIARGQRCNGATR